MIKSFYRLTQVDAGLPPEHDSHQHQNTARDHRRSENRSRVCPPTCSGCSRTE
jgi:hypothetical protein